MQVAITLASNPAVRHSMKFDKQLGQGKFKVFLVKSPSLNAQYALKVFSRDWKLKDHYGREKECMANLDHPNIIQNVPILSHNFRMDIMLTEYVPNGDMLDFVTKGYLRDETLVRSYFHQLIEGITYLHNQGIAHLDLKLENLLLDKDYYLKIIDFDQSQHISERKLYSLGTAGYKPPEVRDKTCENFFAVDIYAAGIILFALLACEFPFVESDDHNNSEVTFYDQFCDDNEQFWKDKTKQKHDKAFFSQEFKDLLNGMCRKDAKERFNLDDIKRSKWYNSPLYSGEDFKRKVKETVSDNMQEPEP